MINLMESETASVDNIVHINAFKLSSTKTYPTFNINYGHNNISNTRSAST